MRIRNVLEMSGPLLVAVAGYTFTYYNSKVAEERKARIERVNKQLQMFYGPMLAHVTATKSAYDAMIKLHSPDGTREAFQKAMFADPHSSEARAYRTWMRIVLQPMNEKTAATIVEHIDLLDSSKLEPLLLQIVAHVSAYRVILEKWDEGDFTLYSVIPYPNKLVDWVRLEFGRMKHRQAELLGTATKLRSKL